MTRRVVPASVRAVASLRQSPLDRADSARPRLLPPSFYLAKVNRAEDPGRVTIAGHLGVDGVIIVKNAGPLLGAMQSTS